MIPINTTTITVRRIPDDETVDPTEEAGSGDIIAEGVRAVISSPSGRERNVGGSQEVVEFALSCDPIDLDHEDSVVDEETGDVYQVVWATRRLAPDSGPELEHTRAGLKRVAGLAQ